MIKQVKYFGKLSSAHSFARRVGSRPQRLDVEEERSRYRNYKVEYDLQVRDVNKREKRENTETDDYQEYLEGKW